MNKTLWEILDNITRFKDDWDKSFKKNYNQFYINRFFAQFNETLDIIEEVSLYKMTDEKHYRLLKDIIPYDKYFIKFKIKSDREEYVIDIMNFYNISEKNANVYINFIDAKTLEEIKNHNNKRREFGFE